MLRPDSEHPAPRPLATSGKPAQREASSLSRRSALKAAGLGLLAPWVTGCAVTASAPGVSVSASSANVELLYYADTLDARVPGYPIVPATRLGPAEKLGQAPWATAASVEALTGPLDTPTRQLTDPRLATQRRFGGYAVLASRLAGLREALGHERTLTLENGQCWNGSGLSHFTQGQSGVEGSRLLGAEARVSSDERLIWPGSVATRYREYGAPVLGTLAEAQNPDGLVTPSAFFERGGARIAVVGVSDPHAHDETRTLDAWYAVVVEQTHRARSQADLVVVLADTGTGPGLWLAERLTDADLLLCARGQDFWPELIAVPRNDGGTLPVCLPGTRGSGLFQLSCRVQNGQWHIEAHFHAATKEGLSPEEHRRVNGFQHQLDVTRAPFAAWLDRPLATAPDWLWRRDVVGGNWDALINAALGQEASDGSRTLSPGLRYDVVVAPGEAITREHLLLLSGGHDAPVFTTSIGSDGIQELFERASDQCFGLPLLLDNAADLPRIDGIDWQCRYAGNTGQRVTLPPPDASRLITWSTHPDAPAGEPLWQVLERFLNTQPPGWQLPPRPAGTLTFVEGHPGWHPEARLGST